MKSSSLACPSHMSTRESRIRAKSLQNDQLVYLECTLNFEIAIVRYCSREVSELLIFISDLRRNWRRETE